MADGWRAFVQRFLRSAADRFEKKSIKKWTAEEQRTGIAVLIGVMVTSVIWIVILYKLIDVFGPNPPCEDGACVQAMWQGRWAMWSFVGSVMTVAAVIFGFWQTHRIHKRQSRGSLAVSVTELPRLKDGTGYLVRALVRNYGKSPALEVRARVYISFLVTVNAEIKEYKTKIANVNQGIVYPGDPVPLKMAQELHVDDLCVFENLSLVQAKAEVYIDYIDIFGDPNMSHGIGFFGGRKQNGAYEFLPIGF